MLLQCERLPEYCFECRMLGHSIRECDRGSESGDSGNDMSAYSLWMRAASLVKSRSGRSKREYIPAEPEMEEIPLASLVVLEEILLEKGIQRRIAVTQTITDIQKVREKPPLSSEAIVEDSCAEVRHQIEIENQEF
ncbi:hypothetical protein ACOSQ3_027529 [Xanthoceras sorbifolium]